MNKAIIVYDCWDKHWHGSQIELDDNCKQINTVIQLARDNGYIIIHNPSDCIGKTQNNYKFNPLPKTDYLLDIAEQPIRGVKWKVWTKQNDNIKINKHDYMTENIDELINIINCNNIQELYYVGYHINLCILWARETSIGNLKQHIDIETYIIKDLSKALLKDYSNIQSVYDICEHDYKTKLINSIEL